MQCAAKGEIAAAILKTSRSLGGAMTAEDLASFSSEWVQPISIDYRGWRVYEMPPNGQGMALATIYNQLNQQAQMQAYQDVYMELSWMSVGLVALAFLLSRNKPGAGASGAAMH